MEHLETNEQEFLTNLEKTLWMSANKLLPSLDASQYKHVVLGLVFLKYVSDSFQIRREELKASFQDPDNDYYYDPEDYEGGAEGEAYQAEINSELEERDYYTESNVFWLPRQARWDFIQNQNKVVINGVIWLNNQGEVLTQAPDDEAEKRKCKRISSVGQLIDNALEAFSEGEICKQTSENTLVKYIVASLTKLFTNTTNTMIALKNTTTVQG